MGATLLIVGTCLLSLFYFSSASADIDAETKASTEAAYLQGDANEFVRSVSFAMPSLSQYPELPTGCESVALTDVLLSYGFDLNKTDIADKWLPTSEQDFVCAFLGDPHTPEGHSCMAPGLTSAARSYLAAQNSSLKTTDLTGASFEEVLKEVAEQHPVIIWCTIGLEAPGDCYLAQRVDGRLYRLITNSHCIVVNGYDLDTGTVLVCDPLVGQAAYPLEKLAARYYALGAQAVVIR
ncbi:MAG: C39 family peptidase [Gordonibacter sp.]|nr:C39 family peptidase [Gordonibacter sp.]